LVVFAGGAAGPGGATCRSGFLGRRRTRAYLFGALQLPSSLVPWRGLRMLLVKSRHSSARRPASKSISSVIGYKPIEWCQHHLQTPFFLYPRSNRGPSVRHRAESYAAIKRASATFACDRARSAFAFVFPPPGIPGVGSSGGFTFLLEDRSGARSGFPGGQQQAIHRGRPARVRPELTGLNTPSPVWCTAGSR